MDDRTKKLLEDCTRTFEARKYLETTWQDIALNFYPEAAEFTTTRAIGAELLEHLTTSYPVLARRSLGDALSALLRPVNLDSSSPGVWFAQTVSGGKPKDVGARRWLERSTEIQRRAMYDRDSKFVRATKEGDHSFATFGQTAIKIEMNRRKNALLYRCQPLRDIAWRENADGDIDPIYVKWKPTAQQVVETFGDKVHRLVREKAQNDPAARIECRHIVISADAYDQRDAAGKKFRTPWISIWIDQDNEHVMEEQGTWTRGYVIPRWVTVPGSQYASSPAVTVALPDARLLQAMTLSLLEAAEKFADPPIVATQEVVKSRPDLRAGGITWVDMAYDEKEGAALRPLFHQAAGQGLRFGVEMAFDVREQIAKAFFLDSLALPPISVKEMTAFEVGQRISEWIRRAMPIFEPMEFEYNGGLCDETFELLIRNGAFGPMNKIPRSLLAADIEFKFESPLHESADRRKGQKFLEAKAALIQAAELDPTVLPTLNMSEALNDVLAAIGVPAAWQRDEFEIAELKAEAEAAQQTQELLGGAGAAAEVAKNLGAATKDFAQAGGQ